MKLLTPEQLQEIRQIVEDHHDAFIVNTIGADVMTPEVLARLREQGLVGVKVESVKDAYIYGQLLATMQSDRIATMSFAEFKAYLKKNPVPLSAAEMHAVQMAQQSAGQYTKGLGNRVGATVGSALIEADAGLRAATEGIIRDATALNIARRETVQKLKSDLGWATKDWARDWNRIAVTEKQNAMQRGVADHYRDEYGPDVLVARRAMPSACQYCQRFYNGPDGQPRIFRLRDLEANGTNVGRKAAAWLPVSGTTHPFCMCMTIRIPEGWGFDEEGDLVPGGKLGQRYKSAEDVARSMSQEADLQKAFKLQGHVNFRGLPIDIENKAGSVRKWKDGQGGSGETKMTVGYGYIRGTNGIDEDEIDVFVGPDPKAEMVYVIEQQTPETGVYDEQKTFVGFSNQKLAEQCYNAHYDRPGFMLYTTAMELDQFKRWIQSTAPKKGEMMKARDAKHRLVIPLAKARVSAEIGAVTSQAGNQSPSPGTSPNYIIRDTPSRPVPPSLADVGYRPDARQLAEDFAGGLDRENVLKVDKEVYEINNEIDITRPVEVPESWVEAAEQAREGADRRMHYLKTERVRNAGRPKNKVDVDTDDYSQLDKLTKAGPFIGPRGGKWADAKHTIPWDDKLRGKLKKTKTELLDLAKLDGKLPGDQSLAEHISVARKFLVEHKRILPKSVKAIESIAGKSAKLKFRVKTLASALGKMVRKPKYTTADTLQDGAGIRVIHDTVDQVLTTVKKLKTKYKVVDEDDYISTPQNSYRSYHLILEDPDTGLPFEVQVRTQNQDKFADWAHNIYKPLTPEQEKHKNDPVVLDYEKQVSEYFWGKDTDKDPLPPKPQCPLPVKSAFGCL